MDMMSASLGFAGIAVYLLLRERNLILAVLLSQCLVVLDGLTHPNGITAFAGVLLFTMFFDFRRLNIWILHVAIIPYLIGGVAFGLWVLQDPGTFKDQFINNAMMGGRMSGFSSPAGNILREFTERYPHAFGLQAHSGGHAGPIFLKGFILVGYAAGILGVLLISEIRRNQNYSILLLITVVFSSFCRFWTGKRRRPILSGS